MPCAESQVFWYRIRRLPPPLSVTRPPPSSTIRSPVRFRIFAVAVIVMVTGAGPQLNVMIPPAATAFTTAAEVQPRGVPSPTTWSGLLVFTALASAGTTACPAGLPGRGSAGILDAGGDGDGDADGGAAGDGDGGPLGAAAGSEVGGVTNAGLSADPHPASIATLTRAAATPTR